jgi:hypothetical protein
MLLTTIASLALAGEVGPSATLIPTIARRQVKVDLFSLAPGRHPWGTDWKMLLMEQWSVVLDCEPVQARVERCEMPHGLWWGSVAQGTNQVVLQKVSAPEAIEIAWTPRGRVGSFDVVGDRSAFWTEISNTVLKLSFHRADMVFKPDAQRRIGQDIELGFARQIASALEWELPKKGDASKPWTPSQTPWAGRRWVQSTSSHKVKLSVAETTPDAVELVVEGTVTERVAETSVADLAVDTRIVGRATWDPARGTLVRAKTETLTTATDATPLVGYTRSITVVATWTPEDSTEPLVMPNPEL